MLEVLVIPFCVHIVSAGLPDGLFRFCRAVVHSLPLLPLYYTRNAHKMQGAGQFLYPLPTPPRAAWRAYCPPYGCHAARTHLGNSAGRQGRNLRKVKLRELPAAWRAHAPKKNSRPIGRLLFQCWRTPIFPGRHQPSIFGTNELNFRVRDGNGWTLVVINTNYSLSSGSPDSFLMIPLLSPDCKHFFRDFYTFLPFYHI